MAVRKPVVQVGWDGGGVVVIHHLVTMVRITIQLASDLAMRVRYPSHIIVLDPGGEEMHVFMEINGIG